MSECGVEGDSHINAMPLPWPIYAVDGVARPKLPHIHTIVNAAAYTYRFWYIFRCLTAFSMANERAIWRFFRIFSDWIARYVGNTPSCSHSCMLLDVPPFSLQHSTPTVHLNGETSVTANEDQTYLSVW